MTDGFIFGLGCGVTAIAFGGVYIYMRGTFEAMVEPPHEQRGASIQNLDDVPADPERREVVEREQSGVGLH